MAVVALTTLLQWLLLSRVNTIILKQPAKTTFSPALRQA